VVERGPEKAGVGGSIPSLATTLEDNRTFLILEGRLEVVRVAALHEHFGCEIGRPKRVSSPASAFSENFDDLCEALAAVLPVSLEASLHAIGVASNNCADHLIVLRHRKVEILDDRAGIQPPIAFCLRLDGFVEGQEPGSGAGLDDGSMEVPIKVEDSSGAGRPGGYNFAQLIIEALEASGDLHTLRLGEHCGAPARQAFDVANNRIQLARILLRQGCDDHARLACVLVLDHIAFALQPVKSAAHRSAAHSEVLRQIRFYNPGSRREPAMDDEFADWSVLDREGCFFGAE
jgi:hypothetical protein